MHQRAHSSLKIALTVRQTGIIWTRVDKLTDLEHAVENFAVIELQN